MSIIPEKIPGDMAYVFRKTDIFSIDGLFAHVFPAIEAACLALKFICFLSISIIDVSANNRIKLIILLGVSGSRCMSGYYRISRYFRSALSERTDDSSYHHKSHEE